MYWQSLKYIIGSYGCFNVTFTLLSFIVVASPPSDRRGWCRALQVNPPGLWLQLYMPTAATAPFAIRSVTLAVYSTSARSLAAQHGTAVLNAAYPGVFCVHDKDHGTAVFRQFFVCLEDGIQRISAWNGNQV